MIIEPSSAIEHRKAELDKGQSQTPEKPLPRFFRPEWVNVYITAVYAVIAGLTLFTIKRQADIMDRQAKDTRVSSAQTFDVLKEQTDNLLISAKAATVSAMAADESARAALAQTELMKTQASHMASQLDEMQRQADLMEDQIRTARERERARISIYEVWPVLFASKSEDIKPNIPMKIEMIVINDGPGSAFNVRARGHTSIGSPVDPRVLSPIVDDPEDWYDLAIPSTIRTSGAASKTTVTVTHMAGLMDETYESVERETVEGVIKGELSLTIGGEITYEDVWGDEHKTPFLYLWDARVGTDVWVGSARVRGGWVDLSGKSA